MNQDQTAVPANVKLLHERALLVSETYRKSEAELLGILQEIDRHRGYYAYGCKSLFAYAVRWLKLSESVASNFNAVARKALEVPELKLVIDQGELGVSKARKITPVLTPENHSHWLTLAVSVPQKKLEREVAQALPVERRPERARFLAEKRVSLSLEVSEEVYELLRRVQDLESQSKKKVVKFGDAVAAALRLYVEKRDPVEKARRSQEKNDRSSKTPQVEGSSNASASVARQEPEQNQAPRKIPAAIRDAVQLRDQGQCTHVENDVRCPERRWIDVHHLQPRAQGGKDIPENLALLCSGHHRLQHRRP